MYNLYSMKAISIVIAILILYSNVTKGQSSKKGTVSFYNQLSKIKVSEIKEGNYLHIAKKLTTDKFVQYYLETGKKIQNKKYGYISFEKLYTDSLFTYFGRIHSYGLVDFIKVENRELPSVDFIELDGQKLREQFISEIIPEIDESRVKRKGKNCTSATFSRDFKYTYIKDSDEVEIRCHWKIKCDFVTKIINKEYIARYSIDKKEFLK